MRFLLFVSLIAVALSAVDGRRDEMPEGEIEQCQCSKLEGCRESARARHTPCVARCTSKLEDDDWDADAGRRCFEEPPSDAFKQCQHELALKSCSTESGVMLSRNESLPWRPRRKHRSARAAVSANELDEDVDADDDEQSNVDESPATRPDGRRGQQHRSREHNRRNFHAFMKQNFKQSGETFNKCMQKCGRSQHRDACPRELKCGLKRIPRNEWREQQAACHKLQKPRRFAVCECLQKAGKKNLDCSFGRKKDE